MAARGGQFSHPLGLEYVLLVVQASFLPSYSLSIMEFHKLYLILTNNFLILWVWRSYKWELFGMTYVNC